MIFDIKIDFESQIFGTHFETSPLHQFSNFNNFFWVPVLILRQKSFQFCTPRLKTQQPVLPYRATLDGIGILYMAWTSALQLEI